MAGRRIALVCAGETAVAHNVAALARGLEDNGDRVAVVAPSRFADEHGLRDSGVLTAALDIPADVDVIAAAKAAWVLRSMLRGGAGSDVVHAFGLGAGLAVSLAGTGGAPLVASWWDDIELAGTGVKDRLRRQPEWLVARRADVNLCASADLVSAVLRLGGSDARHVLVGVPETVAAETTQAGQTDPVEQADALYRELTGR